MAWAVVIESALLNDRLTEDMRSAAEAKGCACSCGEGMDFFGPEPGTAACEAFNEYVRCRWPIHVFALDPVTQEQNIQDAFSRRRELQLALSLGFVSGQMNAESLTRFARRLETDMETIALNKTAIGFSHGDDTFGWRFFPRFQSPPTPGTLQAFGETLLGGPSPDCDLLQRQIEPGMRECVAIVIMPSFVPYVTFDVRTNWFRLTHREGWLPTRHDTEISMVETMKLSRSIKTMHDQAQMLCDAQMYRDGEVPRLLRRVEQLDRELPLQTMQAQVPIENTLGGFQMFNNGVTDLAPDLYGWYGGPGIVAAKDATTVMFLVGDHFSVHDTKVIAGNRGVEYKLLSRQVMQVTIPGDLEVNRLGDEDFVDVHIATPYGVTSHLHIPAFRPPTPPPTSKPKLGWQPTAYNAVFTVTTNDKGKNEIQIVEFQMDPAALFVRVAPLIPPPSSVAINFTATRGKDILRTFTVDKVPFDFGSGQFYLAGDQLGDFHKKVTEVAVAFLTEQEKEQPIAFSGVISTSATQVAIPDAVTITFKKK